MDSAISYNMGQFYASVTSGGYIRASKRLTFHRVVNVRVVVGLSVIMRLCELANTLQIG